MEHYINKDALVAEIERLKSTYSDEENIHHVARYNLLVDILSFIDTIEVKDGDSIWHSIDDIPNFNLNGVSDLIIDSCYGHICREAHYYTPERWNTHIGFNTNRQFRWAYEKDLINFD